MSTSKRLSKIFSNSIEVPFDNSAKIVIISDCHRGDGSWADDFSQNQNIYYSALKYYNTEKFTYIDLGDSDELWKNRSFSKISDTYPDTFGLIHEFYEDGRLYIIFGNHDIVKKDPEFVKENLTCLNDNRTGRCEPLFDEIKVHEGLKLIHSGTNTKLFLVHGHQGDLIADILWRLGRFLSRNVWRSIESFGLRDPTSAAINYAVTRKVEKKIIGWAEAHNQIIITGHTHRPSCPSEAGELYFNDGCCIYQNCMTCLEIVNSEIALVKWDIKTDENRVFYVDREVIAKPRKIGT